MKTLLENWKRYINEQSHIMGNYEGQTTEKKDKLISFFDDLKNMSKETANQIASVLLGTKPLYLGPVNVIPNNKFSQKFLDYLRSRNMMFASAPNIMGTSSDIFFIGNKDKVAQALELQKNPYIGIEKMGFPSEFKSWAKENAKHEIAATPEYHKRMGILLGYGEANSEKFSQDYIPKWKEVYSHWQQQSQNTNSSNSSKTEVL
jgi:hypothetical protein